MPKYIWQSLKDITTISKHKISFCRVLSAYIILMIFSETIMFIHQYLLTGIMKTQATTA
jgi:hypothetical protein